MEWTPEQERALLKARRAMIGVAKESKKLRSNDETEMQRLIWAVVWWGVALVVLVGAILIFTGQLVIVRFGPGGRGMP